MGDRDSAARRDHSDAPVNTFSLLTLVDAYEELLLHVLALEDEWRLDDRISRSLLSGR
jgi:hypothetical protein